jgi:hypothetical protein
MRFGPVLDYAGGKFALTHKFAIRRRAAGRRTSAEVVDEMSGTASADSKSTASYVHGEVTDFQETQRRETQRRSSSRRSGG